MPNSVKTVLISVFSALFMVSGFLLLKSNLLSQILTAPVAIVWGVLSVILLFYSLNLLAQLFPQNAYNKIVPYIFIGPAILIMGWYLFIPTVRSIVFSFMDKNSAHSFYRPNNACFRAQHSHLACMRHGIQRTVRAYCCNSCRAQLH